MRKTQFIKENRREHMRVSSRMHFCISVISGADDETGKKNISDCFCTVTSDISLGGMCISHDGSLKKGMGLQISTPHKLTKMNCLSCEKSFMFKNRLELDNLRGDVVWATEDKCGISFTHMSIRNENILSKFIWEEHLSHVRDKKKTLSRRKA